MFLDFYQLREQPFDVSPDPRYLYMSGTHREALAAMFCGIETGRGFQALIAEPGMGKTSLLFQLLERLQRSARSVLLFQTQCDSRELLRYLLGELGIDSRGMDQVGMHEALKATLVGEMLAGRRFVLVIDEAQNLEDPVLETVRLLSDFETPSTKLLQIVLAGQPQLATKLARPSLEQLRQRISILSHLQPFDSEEVRRYIEHRLQVAEYRGGPLFTPGALELIATRSRGIPRNINNLCFNALAVGYALGRRTIDAEVVEEAVSDLDINAVVKRPRVVRASSPGTPPRPAAPPRIREINFQTVASRNTSARGMSALITVAGLILVGWLVLSPTPVGWWTALWHPSTASASSTSVPKESVTPDASPESRSAPDPVPAEGNEREQDAAVASAPAPEVSDPAKNLVAPAKERGALPEGNRPREIFVIVVQPKQDLREICLYNLGRYSDELVQEIMALNPEITDPDRIAVGQELWLPGPPAGRIAGSLPAANGSSTAAR